MTDEDGKPIELGRGAMGVTYKAFDVDLRCPVALKLISERYLGDESARLRFLREARAAASLRHPNVASVFHLGRSGEDYFYAMEFVEGETLENLIKHSGRLEAKLALEIATQVAAGLAAVHKQNFVHRDIKPANIMVGLEEANVGTVKIIDLGLARQRKNPNLKRRSRFLGVSLHHQSSPALNNSPDSAQTSVREVLLQKDPRRRFQTPSELLNALTTIEGAIDAGRTITHQSLQKIPPPDLSGVTRKSPAQRGPEQISVARLPVTGKEVFGRTTRVAVADLAQYEGSSALRRDLEHLSSEAGEKLLRALEVKGQESELLGASEEFGGHCLALTLLGSYLSDAYNGEIRRREEVANRLAHDVRQGAHARKVMDSYQSWFGEGPELSVLLLLGLFDRPVDEKAIEAMLNRILRPELF